ncbi:MAG TPA: LysR substrate-binding domain-containing protein [Dongiaceae bacterium]|nr:LysR substrate-binding domain-containing protein [Dongiaceae bacterium]
MNRNLDIALLRSFVAVAESGSMTAAANALNLTQGAVSQQIKRLEDVLCGSLFERDRRGLKLTASGERLFGKAKRLLSLNDEICADLTADALKGRLRIGVPYDLVETRLAPVLKAFADAYPQVEISLICETSPKLAQALAGGEIDLAIIEEAVGKTAGGECLGIERLVWVGAKGGTAHGKRPLPLSLVSETCAFRPFVLAALEKADIAWRTVFENGIEATRTIVRADLAVTAWLTSTVPADLVILAADNGLPELPGFTINLHLPRYGAMKAATEFARYLRDGMAAHHVSESAVGQRATGRRPAA